MTNGEIGAHYHQKREEILAFLADEVGPEAAGADLTERYPRPVIKRAAEMGLFAATTATHGGNGWDDLSIGFLHEAAGRVCTAFRSLLTVQGIVARSIARWGTDQQKTMWLPKLARGEMIAAFCASEEGAGCDLSKIACTATRVGKGYALNGEKLWVTFGGAADIFLVIAILDDKPTAFLVPRSKEGLSVTHMPGMLGLRGAEISAITFTGVELNDEHRLGAIGAGLMAVTNYALDFGRYSVAWGALGLSAACLSEMVAWSQTRQTSGARLSEHQLIKEHLAEAATDIRLGQEFCKSVAKQRYSGALESVMIVNMAKFACSRTAMSVAWRSIQVLGASGMRRGSLTERFFRDAKVLELIEGTHEIQKIVLSEMAARSAAPL